DRAGCVRRAGSSSSAFLLVLAPDAPEFRPPDDQPADLALKLVDVVVVEAFAACDRLDAAPQRHLARRLVVSDVAGEVARPPVCGHHLHGCPPPGLAPRS